MGDPYSAFLLGQGILIHFMLQPFLFGYTLAPEEQVQVEEQHNTQVNAEATYFVTQGFNGGLGRIQLVPDLENVQGKTNIEQVKPDTEQSICGYCDLFTPVEDIFHKYDTVAEQRMSYIIGQ
jgi:hypothetical protein